MARTHNKYTAIARIKLWRQVYSARSISVIQFDSPNQVSKIVLTPILAVVIAGVVRVETNYDRFFEER